MVLSGLIFIRYKLLFMLLLLVTTTLALPSSVYLSYERQSARRSTPGGLASIAKIPGDSNFKTMLLQGVKAISTMVPRLMKKLGNYLLGLQECEQEALV